MTRTVVINLVGLTRRLLARGMPRLAQWAARGATALIRPAFPAVTCTAQADYLTGVPPDVHGIVANGWYDRDDGEIKFWKQANPLVRAPKVWDILRREDPGFTVANLFWWFNMHSTVDYAVTPRPMYRADGRKIPDVYTTPPTLRRDLQAALGTFPLFEFWGPRASIRSTRWIADAARIVEDRISPTLTLLYLPHLDYNLQRLGVSDPALRDDLVAADTVVSDLIDHYTSQGVTALVVSEYGIRDVSTPVHLNRVLREHGLLAVREELGGELLDPGASAAFVVADHQVAHVYVNDSARVGDVRALLEDQPGVHTVLGAHEQEAARIRHHRSGDLVAVAAPDAWFTYYYWLDDHRAPDYARTVDIHRKPGYDPVELFLDPALRVPALAVGWKLFKRSLGLRTLLDVIPLDATLIRGSHGRPGDADDDGPIAITLRKDLVPSDRITSLDVRDLILSHVRASR